MAKIGRHLQGNLLCAVDVETTGFLVGKHDVVQVAVLPLDSDFRLLTTVMPFYMNLQPKRPENIDPDAMRTSRLNLADLIINGCEPYKAADLFVEWFYGLELGLDKRIVPVAHNWQFDKGFMVDWLGAKTYDAHFHYSYRDTMIALNFLNDRAAFNCETIPFSKLSLGHLCSVLGVVNDKPHDALADCAATAECYRRLLQRMVM